MKFLFVVFTVLLVAQLATSRVFSRNDISQSYEDQSNVEVRTITTATEALYIPMSLKICKPTVCESVCKQLGFHHGQCVASNVCHCYN